METINVKVCPGSQDWSIGLFDIDNKNWYQINSKYAKACGLKVGTITFIDCVFKKNGKYTNVDKIIRVYKESKAK